jgi:hypothetical protein
MNARNQHGNIARGIASSLGGLLSRMRFLFIRRNTPGHFEQRCINGFITRVWVPAARGSIQGSGRRNAPKSRSARPSKYSGGAGSEVNSAAAAYMSALRLEPSHMETKTHAACL